MGKRHDNKILKVKHFIVEKFCFHGAGSYISKDITAIRTDFGVTIQIVRFLNLASPSVTFVLSFFGGSPSHERKGIPLPTNFKGL